MSGPSGVDRPNVVLITCHDLGQHVGCYGVEAVETPNLDGLAERGVRFENACATAPVCSPARGSLLTGRYPQSNGLLGLTHGPWWWSLGDDETCLPALLREAGYDTHLAGFQHVVDDPRRLGVDAVHSEDCDAAETAAAARTVFSDVGEGPVYAQFGFTEVHRPFDAAPGTDEDVFVPPYLEATDAVREDFAAFQATIARLDRRVGELLDALEETGHRDDTVVVFAADHGIPHPGAKWTCRRPGLETALLMDGPGPAFERTDPVTSVVSGVDVAPTLLDVCGVSIPESVEGRSFRPHLEGDAGPPRDAAFAQFTEAMKRDNESRAVMTEDQHLIRYFDQGRSVDYPVAVDPRRFAAHVERMPTTGRPRPFVQLYDLDADPFELRDLAAEDGREEAVADLSSRLYQWMASVDDPLLDGRVRHPYYERALADLESHSTARD
jgi:arylsulfatase A-like enzyme